MRTYFEHRLETIRKRGEEGFTLIELLVVLLIIGILLGIAIPTFMSVTQGASNTAVQSNVQTALTAADAFYTQNGGTYGTFANTSLSGQDTGLTFVGTAAGPDAKTISWYQPTSTANNDLVFAAWSSSTGVCFAAADIKDTAVPGTTNDTFASNTAYGWFKPTGGQTGCTATAAYGTSGVAASGAGAWQTSGFPST